MKNQLPLFWAAQAGLFLLLALGATALFAQPNNPADLFAPDRILVAFQPGTAASAIATAHSQAAGQVVKTIDALGLQVISVPHGEAQAALARYQGNPNVQYAELNYRRLLFRPGTNEGSEPTLGITNNFNEQWGLHNTGQSFGATVDPIFGTLTAPAFTGVPDADIDYFDNLAYFSTFSSDSDDWVSVAAPGHTILSAVPGDQCGLPADDPEGCYAWKSGTSMAAPHVSGVAAMLWSYLPSPTNIQVRQAIENGADATGALGQNLRAWTQFGRVNLFRALTDQSEDPGPGSGDTTSPVISNVSSAQLKGPRFQITWETDEPSTSVVLFTCCGEISDSALVTQHSVTFQGQKHVSYEYFVRSTDTAGNQAIAWPFVHQN